jgi:hypothetical protein
VLEQLLEIERNSSQEHSFMRTTAAFCVDPAHPVVLEQAAKHRFYRALPQPAHAPA